VRKKWDLCEMCPQENTVWIMGKDTVWIMGKDRNDQLPVAFQLPCLHLSAALNSPLSTQRNASPGSWAEDSLAERC